jgi:hypothetical protein
MDAHGLDRLRPPRWGATVVAASPHSFLMRDAHIQDFPVAVEASFAAVAGKTPTDLPQGARAPDGYEPASTLKLRLTAFAIKLLMFEC